MVSVNDGSVVWQIIKFSEADTLGGLTANDIKSQAINEKVVQVQGQIGRVTLSTKGSQTYTIPVPSGYNRDQCAYIVSEEYDEITDDRGNAYSYILVNWSSVNQSNGVITATVGGSNPKNHTTSIEVDYIVISAK